MALLSNRRASRRPWALVAAPVLGLAACSTSPGSTGPTGTAAPSGTAATGTAAPGGSATGPSFTTLVELAKALDAKGVTCKLQYEALHDEATGKQELSLCTVDGDLLELVIWTDPATVPKLVASVGPDGGAVAYGRNWTVSGKKAAVARRIAGALGGAVAGG